MTRLICSPDRLIEVALAALCDARTVERYLAGLHMLRATESLITKAIRELPEPAQLQIPSVAGSQPPKRLGGVSPTMGQPGEIRSCPPGLGDCTSPTPGTAAETSPTISVAGAGDDPAGSPDVSREPKSPPNRTPAGISSEMAAKTCCQPAASNRPVGVWGMSGEEPGCGVVTLSVPVASIPAPPPPADYTNDVRPLPRPLVIGVPLSPERCAQLNAETPPYRPKRCHVTLLVVGPDGSESEVRA